MKPISVIKQPMGFGAELFSIDCPAPMCGTLRFYSKALADGHYDRIHKDRKHWAYIK